MTGTGMVCITATVIPAKASTGTGARAVPARSPRGPAPGTGTAGAVFAL
jgi:hypothetical protein